VHIPQSLQHSSSKHRGNSPKVVVFKVRSIPSLCRWVESKYMPTETTLFSLESMLEVFDRPQFSPPFPPLAKVNKPNLTTAETAYYLDRRPQTLRVWACLENGPIRPKRIGGILAWSTAEVKALAGVSA
jgi:hypothetical protein